MANTTVKNTTVIKGVIGIYKRNVKLDDQEKKETILLEPPLPTGITERIENAKVVGSENNKKASLLEAAKPKGILGYLGVFGRFLERCFGKSSVESREAEIRHTSHEIYAKLSDHSQINHDTYKVLHENLDKGYIIRQEGFELFIYTISFNGPKYINKVNKSYTVNIESRDTLVSLNDENEYNNFRKELKGVFFEPQVWNKFLVEKSQILINELKHFDLETCINYAKNKLDRFNAVSDKALDFNKPKLTNEEELEVLKFYISNNEKLSNLLTEYNSDVLDEIYNKTEGSVKEDGNDYGVEHYHKLMDLIRGLWHTFSDKPSKKLSEIHENNKNLFKSAFKDLDVSNLDNELRRLKVDDKARLCITLKQLKETDKKRLINILNLLEKFRDDSGIEEDEEAGHVLEIAENEAEARKWRMWINAQFKNTDEIIRFRNILAEFVYADKADSLDALLNQFKGADVKVLYKILEKDTKSDELQNVMKKVTKLSFSNLDKSVPTTLHNGLNQGYRIVLEGSRIFLYTGKPFIEFNDKLKEELVDFTGINERDFNKVKSSISNLVEEQTGMLQKVRKLNAKIRHLNQDIKVKQGSLNSAKREVEKLIAKAKSANKELDNIKDDPRYQIKIELENDLEILENKLKKANEELENIQEDQYGFFR